MWSHLKNVIRSLFYIPQMFGYDEAFSVNPEKDSIDPWTISVYSLLVMKLNKAESQLIRICECMCFCALDHVLHVLPFEHLCYPDSTLFDRHTLTPRRGLWDIYVCLSLIACLSLSLSRWIMFSPLSPDVNSSSVCVLVGVCAWAKCFTEGNEICCFDWHVSAFSPCSLPGAHFLSCHFIGPAYSRRLCQSRSLIVFLSYLSLLEYQDGIWKASEKCVKDAFI